MITIGFLFWLLMILWVVLVAIGHWRAPAPSWPAPSEALIFILFLLLGIQVFGWPIRA